MDDRVLAWPLSHEPGQPRAYKVVYPSGRTEPEPASHDGFQRVYVLSGRLRLVLGAEDLTLTRGETAEFDTRIPHWLGSTGDGAVEALVLFGQWGERPRLRISFQ